MTSSFTNLHGLHTMKFLANFLGPLVGTTVVSLLIDLSIGDGTRLWEGATDLLVWWMAFPIALVTGWLVQWLVFANFYDGLAENKVLTKGKVVRLNAIVGIIFTWFIALVVLLLSEFDMDAFLGYFVVAALCSLVYLPLSQYLCFRLYYGQFLK